MKPIQTYEISNAEYLKGIAENNLSILKHIYNKSLPEVAKYVKRNSGTLEDAKDVFQEGILVVFKKAIDENFELTTRFHVYLFIVCKRIWLRKLKKRGIPPVSIDDVEEFSFEENLEEHFIKTQKWKLFNRKFQSLAEECRKVLKMLFNGFSGKQIAEAMDYSEDYAKRKKYKCKLHLTSLIKSDPEYKNLTE